MSTSKVLKGTALLSRATMISRILGFIYFFPFQLLVGTQGVALYGYAYSWYGILLSFSTAGIPIAVSNSLQSIMRLVIIVQAKNYTTLV